MPYIEEMPNKCCPTYCFFAVGDIIPSFFFVVRDRCTTGGILVDVKAAPHGGCFA